MKTHPRPLSGKTVSAAKPPVALAPSAAADTPSFFSLVRLGAWGFCAVLALGVTVMISRTDRGLERIQQAFSIPNETAAAQVAKTFDAELETRRLAQHLQQQLQGMAADRERLAARVAMLERNLDDVTGSAKTVTTSRITPTQPLKQLDGIDPGPAPKPSAPATIAAVASPPLPANDNKPSPSNPQPPIRAADGERVSPGGDVVATGAVPKLATEAPKLPASRPAPKLESKPESIRPETPKADVEKQDPPRQDVAKLEPAPAAAEAASPLHDFAIDLGSANSIESLRALWLSTRTTHAPLLDKLEPSAILRPTGKNGAPQLRLMAGPFADAGAAAAICRSFAQGRGTCRPFAFDGQKLPLR